MESGNKLRESSQAKAEAETTAVKPTSTPAKPSMTKLTFFKLRNGFLQIQKLKIENKIDTLSKEIYEFKSELKNLLSDKINLSSSVKESFIANVVKNVLKLLIKVSIYPTKDECYGAVKGYLILNYASFFSNFTEDDWIAYYNENIHKQAIFSIFGFRLPPINTNAGPSEVAKWKRKPEVKDCFEGLFKKMNPKDKNSSIVLASVIDRALQNDHSNAELAYVLAICSTILNPNYAEIMCKKNIMKQKVKKFLKKINSQTGIRYSDFEDNSYEEEESGNETEDEDDDV
ncbi:hypothetical protein GLOIN_2v1885941 [Rhizophagus irregularis DAOM 181602=DAOM 197198]|uniref:Uncharacterized protein n=1 Tax=Rhizophagus irregularis (strain DAOM 181602 / DAOM 197198 / MUCL 43194) TaxID=747089 RepID=A0A2P4NYU0_RHIID|nr:hypothetical protein GLOIN_2v1885941 [Rhizophagus irregularis DAOM 181602=DAOM 197198]POG58299.1 hypothetical protein GLOIN_2v1885941 [Rhizophagus irregularis DAOM 181602=DAOM 197198]|eukprot:XP_025165165.1 hypothetical protein GLOIN_2v1885941 [Rhizophagus irregularis DAOM 181602=DAOM 197198]